MRDEVLREHPRTEAIVREELALYYGMISELDAQIGRILDTLNANEQLEHTLSVMAGDNGLAVGSHGLLGKQNLYEHSMRALDHRLPGTTGEDASRRAGVCVRHSPNGHGAVRSGRSGARGGESLLPHIADAKLVGRDALFYAYRDL